MADDTVSIRIRLSGGKEAAGELALVADETKAVGTAAEETGAKTAASVAGTGKWSGRLRSAWSGIKRVAKIAAIGLAGAAIAVAAWGKKAISSTTELAKATSGLHENLGLSVEKSSLLLNLAKVRGADATKFGMSMKSLAAQVRSAATGSTTAEGTFRKLGITQKETERGSKHFGAFLGEVAQGFHETGKGTTRLALAAKLFGKGYATVFPLFREGRKYLDENLQSAREYGAYLTGNGKDSVMEYVQAQREVELANIGLQIAFSENVIPVLIKVFKWIGKTMKEWRKGKGPIHDVVEALKPLAEVLEEVFKWLVKHPVAIEILIGALIAYKVACLAAAAAEAVMMLADPLTWVVLAAAAFVALYLKVKWFHNAVNAVVRFIRKFWPIAAGVLMVMFGPLVAIILLFPKLKNAAVNAFNWIKNAATNAAHWVVNAWNNVKGFFKRLPGEIGHFLSGVGKAIAKPFIWAFNKVKSVWEKIQEIKDKVTGLPGKVLGGAKSVVESVLPWGQHGIRSHAGGLAVVGEAGPELVSLPRGSEVIPHRASKTQMLDTQRFSKARREIRQPIHLTLNGRVLAETVVTIQDDAEARQ